MLTLRASPGTGRLPSSTDSSSARLEVSGLWPFSRPLPAERTDSRPRSDSAQQAGALATWMVWEFHSSCLQITVYYFGRDTNNSTVGCTVEQGCEYSPVTSILTTICHTRHFPLNSRVFVFFRPRIIPKYHVNPNSVCTCSMGVPAFFRWLSRKYPSVIVECVEDKTYDDEGEGCLGQLRAIVVFYIDWR